MNILYIEDAPDVRDMVEMLLLAWGHQVQSFDSAEAGAQALESENTGLLISDMELPGQSGLELTRQALARHPGLQALLLTGHRAEMYRPHLPPRAHIMSKPFDVDELRRFIAALETPGQV